MMKKFFSAVLVLPLVLFAVSCSESDDNGGGGNNGPVNLAPGTDLEQQVYADEQQGPAPIKFTATAPWTATVVEVSTKAEGGSEVDWLKLSAYSGGAGEVSLTMELQPNLTGKDRKAEIRIACGGVTITIKVEQKGTTESGETPKPEPEPAGYALVESIEADFLVGCKENYSDSCGTYHYVFRYDDKNRIAEYEITEYNNYNNGEEPELSYKCTTRFDYTIQDEIRLTEEAYYRNGDYTEMETYRVQLDDQGRATQIKKADRDEYVYEDTDSTITFRYNDEGRLVRISWYEYSGAEESYEAITYQNGVFSKVFSHYEYDIDSREVVFPADAFGDRPNDRLNIDPNWLLFTAPDEPVHMLPMLRLAGKGCDRLTLWLPNDDSELYWGMQPPSEPNVTIHKSYDYYEHETNGRLQYTFNDDGTIAAIVQPIACIQMRHEFDIVVGSELSNPEYPEDGYKWTIENETDREVGRSADRHEWRFTYRK